jgi:hypothetical protein
MAIKKEPAKPDFPYAQFPILIMHKDGKELKDTKKCYFGSMHYADKYIVKSNFKQKDYQVFIKPGTNVETVVPSIGRKSKQKKS